MASRIGVEPHGSLTAHRAQQGRTDHLGAYTSNRRGLLVSLQDLPATSAALPSNEDTLAGVVRRQAARKELRCNWDRT